MKGMIYISRLRLISERAHVYNTLKTCEALSDTGEFDLTLVTTDTSLVEVQGVEQRLRDLGVVKNFKICTFFSLENYLRLSKVPFISKLAILFSNFSLIVFIFKKRKECEFIYCRDPFLYLVALFAKRILNKKVYFEIHAVLHKKNSQNMLERLARLAQGLIVISLGLKQYYERITDNILVSFCSAAEPERFNQIAETPKQLRMALGLPLDKIIIGYTGNLARTGNNDSYGVEDIIRSMPNLPADYIFVGVGKRGRDSDQLEALIKELSLTDRVILLPWVDKQEIARHIKAFDILAIPAAGAQVGNSPTKIFEYLVSGKPIVAAKTQAIAEILVNERNSLLVNYQEPRAWSTAFKRLESQELSQVLVKNAYADGQKFSWSMRGQAIAGFILKHNEKSS